MLLAKAGALVVFLICPCGLELSVSAATVPPAFKFTKAVSSQRVDANLYNLWEV